MRLLRDLRYHVFYGVLLDRRYGLVSLGDTRLECNWNIFPGHLNESSVIYSGGVGNDITFEHALVDRFGANIVLCDPSPTGVATMAKPENQDAHFRFHPVALAGHCGTLTLDEPINAEEGSYRQVAASGTGTISVPCATLAALMQQNRHDRIDLLKIDIEGSEYDVLNEIIRDKLQVRQICVEFHHGILPGIRRSQTVGTILRLRQRGYHLLNQTGNNHTFHWPGEWARRR